MKVVYIDELFAINTLVNYMVLIATARFSGLPFKWRRLVMAAVAGGSYAVAAYFYAQLAWMPVKLMVGFALVLLAFGRVVSGDFIKLATIFYLVSLFFGGAVFAISILTSESGLRVHNGAIVLSVNAWVLILSTGAACLLISAFFGGSGKAARGGTVRVAVRYGGAAAEFTALRDSGNMLRDPLGGAPVIIAEAEAIRSVLSAGSRSLLRESMGVSALVENLSKLEPDARWRLVPYRAVGVDGGMLAAFRPSSVTVGDMVLDNALIAISPTALGAGAGWCALVGEQ